MRDLAYARLLHVRQLVGQFLSGTAPAVLVQALASVGLTYAPSYRAEAFSLSRWLEERLVSCGLPKGTTFDVAETTGSGKDSLSVKFNYTDAKAFFWQADFASHQARFEANFTGEPIRLPSSVRLLAPEASLGEAMFF